MSNGKVERNTLLLTHLTSKLLTQIEEVEESKIIQINVKINRNYKSFKLFLIVKSFTNDIKSSIITKDQLNI